MAPVSDKSTDEFRAMVNEALEATGGPVTAKERAWARRMLSSGKRQSSRGMKPQRNRIRRGGTNRRLDS